MGLQASNLSRASGRLHGHKRPQHPPMSPRGYIPILVGVNNRDKKKFVIHMRVLTDPGFLELLCKSVEEFGFHYEGILRIPFATKDFEEKITTRNMKRKVRVKHIWCGMWSGGIYAMLRLDQVTSKFKM